MNKLSAAPLILKVKVSRRHRDFAPVAAEKCYALLFAPELPWALGKMSFES